MKQTKIILINIFIAIALFSTSIFILVVFSEIARIYKDNYSYKNINCIRSSCHDIYNNYPWAKKHFQEYSRLKFHYESPVVWRANQFNGDTINILPDYQRKTINNNTRLSPQSVSEVYFFGGSVMWGFGSNDENTIPSKFSSLSSMSSFNYAESAWTSDQSLAYFMKLFKKGHRPDYVIFVNGVNDVAKCYSAELNPYGFLAEDELKIKFKESIRTYSRVSFENYFSIPIEFFRRIKIKKIFIQKEKLTGCKTDKDYYEVAKNMVENWKIAHNLVKSYNGQFIAILEPNIYYTDTKIHHSIKIIESDSQLTKKIYSLVSGMASELNYFYDYKSLYNGSGQFVFTDIGSHVGPDANKFMSNKILDIVKNNK